VRPGPACGAARSPPPFLPLPPRSQLNNYGFRKVHTDHYQFGVAGFQRGSPDLLKSLKRHDAQRASKKPGGGHASPGGASAKPEAEDLLSGPTGARVSCVWPAARACTDADATPPLLAATTTALVEVGAYGGMQSEVEQLKRDRLLLLKEVMRLRETSAHTAEEVRTLSSRLAQTEAMQQQMLGFLQQHISPTLFNANSHLLQGRKRRHLLLAPVSPRSHAAALSGDEDEELLLDGGMGGMGGMPIPSAVQHAGGGAGGGDDTYLMSGAAMGMGGAMEGMAGPGSALFPGGASPVGGASRVFLRELGPDEGALPFALRAPPSSSAAASAQQQQRQQLPPPLGADALMPSYNALLPPPPLPDVLQLSDGTAGAEGDIFSWSDLLADLPAGSSGPSGVPAGLPGGNDAAWDAGGLTRMNSADINAIVRDMQLDAQAPGVTAGGGVVVR
jgi:hypothetical protein